MNRDRGCRSIVAVLFAIIIQQAALGQRLMVVSDTQKPLWIETLQVKADDNEDATQRILAEIANESTAVALIHLGDITALSGMNSAWSLIDEARSRIRVPIHLARGNHDYMPFRSWADDLLQQRLGPDAGMRGAWRWEGVAVVLFNSNDGRLSEEENLDEQRWFDSTLTALDEDEAIQWVIAGCHHSPYTNSTIVDPSEYVRERFVPSFIRHKKAVLFIGGHAHAYERFEEQGKTFVVVGGGGGLRQPLLLGDQRRWEDHAPMKTELRMFHYATIESQKSGLRLQIHMLRTDRSGFDITDDLLLPKSQP